VGLSVETQIDAIHTASFKAANVVYDLAAQFRTRQAYEPLENLAVRVQREIVVLGAAAANADENADEDEA